MRRLPGNPNFWLAGFLLWFVVLWGLSSFRVPSEGVPPIPHLDKFVHFGYFFGGSGLLCAWLFRRKPERTNWVKLITTAVVVIALIGALDEYHQSFTPGRSGNDPFDWLADLLGAAAGAFTFKRVHHLLK
jgi:VanZ family protein